MLPAQTAIDDTVRDLLKQTGPCTIDNVIEAFPHHNWNEIFSVIDEMSRQGRVVLRRLAGFGYEVSLPDSCRTVDSVRVKRLPVRFCVGCGHLCDEIHPDFGDAQWIEARQFLMKYALSWDQLDRIDSTCPWCARVLACLPNVRPQTENAGAGR